MDDGEYAECPKCGGDAMYYRCHEPGCEDGWYDMYEDNPNEYEPGDVEMCDICQGKGCWWVCDNCAKQKAA